jgi:hypothetical protein
MSTSAPIVAPGAEARSYDLGRAVPFELGTAPAADLAGLGGLFQEPTVLIRPTRQLSGGLQ